MSNYLLELENEITSRWPITYDKLRKSKSEHIITSFGISVKYNPCWYIFAEYDHSLVTIDLYVVDKKDEFNQNIWHLTSANKHPKTRTIRHIQKYWIKPEEIATGFETIHENPDVEPSHDSIAILTARQVVNHIATLFSA
jgi:rRNA processing protein Krr1/Pno1